MTKKTKKKFRNWELKKRQYGTKQALDYDYYLKQAVKTGQITLDEAEFWKGSTRDVRLRMPKLFDEESIKISRNLQTKHKFFN